MNKKTASTGKPTRGKSTHNAKGKTFTKKNFRSKMPKDFGDEIKVPTNVTLDRMTSEAPRMANSGLIVFPEDSASMQAFGNYCNAPGQENWIEQYNQYLTIPGSAPSTQPPAKIFYDINNRTCNAMRIDITTMFGPTDMINKSMLANPVTMAGMNLKQFIDTSFGTKTDYDPQDLMLYLMGVSAVFPIIAEIKRDLRLVYTIQEDLYPQFTPKGLFTLLAITDDAGRWVNGEGYSYTSLHLRGFVDALNQQIFAFNRLPIPPELAIIGYNDDLFDYIYLDTPDYRTAQLYVFRNASYWKWTEEDMPFPSLLNFNLGAKSILQKLEILASMVESLTALRTSADAMLQNLYNAFGSKDTIHVPTLDIEAEGPLEFKYDERILIAIENMHICDEDSTVVTHFVADADKQAVTGHLYLDPDAFTRFPYAAAGQLTNIPLQFHKDWKDVSHDDIGWALRFCPMFSLWKTDTVYDHDHTPAEVITACFADATMGFAIVRRVFIAHIENSGDQTSYTCNYSSIDWEEAARDFHAAPIAINANYNGMDVIVESYAANRDVEVTYRLPDLVWFWTCLTNNMWASNVNRNAPGSRFRGQSDRP